MYLITVSNNNNVPKVPHRECFGMLIAKLDNIGFAVLSRGLFNN